MREFSIKEQSIIRDKLINGTNLPGLFSDNFQSNGKLMISVHASGNHLFEFFSDTISARLANEELVDVINLLNYLDKEGLIAKYPPSATTLRDFDVDQVVSIGNSVSKKSERFLLTEEAANVAEFVKRNDNYFFKATEPLRVLVAHEFLTLQERQFERSIKITTRGQWISICIALASLMTTAVLNNISWRKSEKLIGGYKADLLIIQRENDRTKTRDSTTNAQQEAVINKLIKAVDSLKVNNRKKSRIMRK